MLLFVSTMDRFSRLLWSIRLVHVVSVSAFILYKNEADYLDCHIMYLKHMNEHEVMNKQCFVFLFFTEWITKQQLLRLRGSAFTAASAGLRAVSISDTAAARSVFTCKVSIPLTVTVDMINSLWLRLLQFFHFGSWDIWKVEKQRFSSRLCWDSCVCVCRAANDASEMTTEEKPVQHTQEPVTVRLLFNVFVVLKLIFLTELLFHYITFIYTTVLESFYFN